MSDPKWTVRSYHATGERVEEFASEADGWAAAKKYLEDGIAVAGPSGPIDPDDERRHILQSGLVVDDVDALDVMFKKWCDLEGWELKQSPRWFPVVVARTS